MRQASIAKSTQVSPVEYIVKTRRLTFKFNLFDDDFSSANQGIKRPWGTGKFC